MRPISRLAAVSRSYPSEEDIQEMNELNSFSHGSSADDMDDDDDENNSAAIVILLYVIIYVMLVAAIFIVVRAILRRISYKTAAAHRPSQRGKGYISEGERTDDHSSRSNSYVYLMTGKPCTPPSSPSGSSGGASAREIYPDSRKLVSMAVPEVFEFYCSNNRSFHDDTRCRNVHVFVDDSSGDEVPDCRTKINIHKHFKNIGGTVTSVALQSLDSNTVSSRNLDPEGLVLESGTNDHSQTSVSENSSSCPSPNCPTTNTNKDNMNDIPLISYYPSTQNRKSSSSNNNNGNGSLLDHGTDHTFTTLSIEARKNVSNGGFLINQAKISSSYVSGNSYSSTENQCSSSDICDNHVYNSNQGKTKEGKTMDGHGREDYIIAEKEEEEDQPLGEVLRRLSPQSYQITTEPLAQPAMDQQSKDSEIQQQQRGQHIPTITFMTMDTECSETIDSVPGSISTNESSACHSDGLSSKTPINNAADFDTEDFEMRKVKDEKSRHAPDSNSSNC